MASCWLFGVLADDPGGVERKVCFRGDFHDEVLPERVRDLPCGTGVMLQGVPGRWTAGHKELLGRWSLPAIDAIRAMGAERERIPLAGVVHAMFTTDTDGIACEVGHLGDVTVLNYAGWKLVHLAAAPRVPVTRAGRFAIVEGDVDLDAVLRPREARIAWEADAVTWHDRAIAFPDGPVVACSRALALFEPVKDLLAAFLGAPVVRVGDAEVELPDGFDRFLRELPRLRLVRAARRSRERGLRPIAEVLDDAGIDDAFDADELGLTPRLAAFRRLLSLRLRDEQAWMWAGEAVLVPIASPKGTVWAWEVVEDGHATYLFRPGRIERLAAALSDPGAPREQLREDPSLGYLDRVWHVSEDASLDRWWAELRRTLASLGCDTGSP